MCWLISSWSTLFTTSPSPRLSEGVRTPRCSQPTSQHRHYLLWTRRSRERTACIPAPVFCWAKSRWRPWCVSGHDSLGFQDVARALLSSPRMFCNTGALRLYWGGWLPCLFCDVHPRLFFTAHRCLQPSVQVLGTGRTACFSAKLVILSLSLFARFLGRSRSPAPIPGPASPAPRSSPASPAPIPGPASPAPRSNPASPAPRSGPASPVPRSGPTSPTPRSSPASPAPKSGPAAYSPSVY